MKRKISILFACIIGVIGLAVGASAMGVIQTVQSELRPDFTVVIDGKEQTFTNAQGEEVYPLLYDGTTYLPLRAIGNLMGKTVYWYENEKRIELKDSTSTVTDADVIVSGDKTPAPSTGGEGITLEQAKAIALEKAGLKASEVTFTKARQEMDDGVWQYEVEFWKDKVEYSAEIRVSDGKITSWDIDQERVGNNGIVNSGQKISLEEAKQIALEKAGLSEDEVFFTEAIYDVDDGVRQYEIEFYYNNTEYSADINAADGTILSWDVDMY